MNLIVIQWLRMPLICFVYGWWCLTSDREFSVRGCSIVRQLSVWRRVWCVIWWRGCCPRQAFSLSWVAERNFEGMHSVRICERDCRRMLTTSNNQPPAECNRASSSHSKKKISLKLNFLTALNNLGTATCDWQSPNIFFFALSRKIIPKDEKYLIFISNAMLKIKLYIWEFYFSLFATEILNQYSGIDVEDRPTEENLKFSITIIS